MPLYKGFKDVDLFDQNWKEPVILTKFQLSNSHDEDFGLDDLVSSDPWKELPKKKIHWTAQAVIRSLGCLSPYGRMMLMTSLHIPDERALQLIVNRGEIQVLLRGRLLHIPQYMNSKCVVFIVPMLIAYIIRRRRPSWLPDTSLETASYKLRTSGKRRPAKVSLHSITG
jgi:hypothetical protein